MKWLLLFIPAGMILAVRHADPMLVFFVSAVAIIPLAQMMGEATEDLSAHLGPATGGLLNASMGTLPDLILGNSPCAMVWWMWSRRPSPARLSGTYCSASAWLS